MFEITASVMLVTAWNFVTMSPESWVGAGSHGMNIQVYVIGFSAGETYFSLHRKCADRLRTSANLLLLGKVKEKV
jgi:hypothetical protein